MVCSTWSALPVWYQPWISPEFWGSATTSPSLTACYYVFITNCSRPAFHSVAETCSSRIQRPWWSDLSSLSHVLPCRYKQNHPRRPSAPDHPPRSFSAKRAAAGFQCPGHCRTRLQWASAVDMCWPQNKVKWNVICIYVCTYNYTVVYII